MADLALGISKTAVQALVDKVKTAFKEEEELRQIVERDIVFIQDEFEMMESFLSTADTQRVKSNVGSTWVRQVWDLSHQMEDCADFIHHLEIKHSRWRFLLRLLPSWCKPGGAQQAEPLDEAVAKIKLLKARVEEVSQRNMRYNFFGDSASKEGPAALMQQEMTSLGTRDDILKATKHHWGSMDLTKLITKEDMDLQVMSVWGTGGKLSAIMKAYHDSRINNNSFKCCAWVKLVDPFSPHDFIDNMMAQFYTNSCQQQEEGASMCEHPLSWLETSTSELAAEFKKLVDKNRYLIVLEDVSSVAQWDAISAYLPDMKNGSRIIVSTHLIEIASLCAGKQYGTSELRKFSPQHSVWVFFKEQSRHHPKGLWTSLGVDRDWMVNSSIVGRDQEVRALFEMIHNDGRVVSVCGTSGVGKSTIVQAACNNAKDKFYVYSWVNVSHPFDPMDFRQQVVENGWHGFEAKSNTVSEYYFESYRSLVVIDGLRSKEDWDSIEGNVKFIRSKDNCIIVITTEDSVARHCVVQEDRVYRIDPLEEGVALDLLRQAFPFESYVKKDKDKIDKLELLVSKCRGLPKEIVALASCLDRLANRPRDIQEMFWKCLNSSRMSELSMEHCETLRLSFEACPQVLKRCIFYLQIFLEASNIRRGRLIRRWMAEGYSQAIGSNSLEEEAKNLFHKIADDFKLIKRAEPWEIDSLILEYIISWQTEEKVFLPLEVTVLEKKLTKGRIGQHLSIGNGWAREEIVYSSLDFSRLRSLTVSGEWQPFLVSDKMSVLRVLDLEDSTIEDRDLDKIWEMVPHLRFLSLRKCTQISQLQDSLGTLRQLQTLDIRDTSVTTLPRGITKLQKLEYKRAGRGNGGMPAGDHQSSSTTTQLVGVRVPGGIGRLKALSSLGAVDVTSESGKAASVLAELNNHQQLKNLHISCTNSSPNVLQSRNLIFPGNLMKLKIEVPGYSLCREDLQAILKLKKIQTLYIRVKEIQGGLLNPFVEQGGARTSSSLPLIHLKVIKIICTSGTLEYDSAMLPKRPKLALNMLSLSQEDILAIGKLEHVHSLLINVKKIDGVLLNVLLCMQNSFGILQVIQIVCSFGRMEYDAEPEQSKLTINMPEYSLSQEEIVAVGKLQQIHTLYIHVKEIHGGLPNVLPCMQEQGGAGASFDPQPSVQRKVVNIVCSLDKLEYEEIAALERHPKLIVKMAKLMHEDIVAIGRLKNMHTVHITAQEIQDGVANILRSMQQQFGQLNYMDITFNSGSFVYDNSPVEPNKHTVRMSTGFLRQEDTLAILKLENIVHVCIHAKEIEGDLINFLVRKQEQDDAGSSVAQPFGELGYFQIDCKSVHDLQYYRNGGKHKLQLFPYAPGIEESVLKNLGKLEWLQALELRLFCEECDGELLFDSRSCGPDLLRQLKELQIASNRSVHVRFTDHVMEKLGLLKFEFWKGSEFKISGLECLPSLKEVRFGGDVTDELKENVRNQLGRHPALPALKLEG